MVLPLLSGVDVREGRGGAVCVGWGVKIITINGGCLIFSYQSFTDFRNADYLSFI